MSVTRRSYVVDAEKFGTHQGLCIGDTGKLTAQWGPNQAVLECFSSFVCFSHALVNVSVVQARFRRIQMLINRIHHPPRLPGPARCFQSRKATVSCQASRLAQSTSCVSRARVTGGFDVLDTRTGLPAFSRLVRRYERGLKQ